MRTISAASLLALFAAVLLALPAAPLLAQDEAEPTPEQQIAELEQAEARALIEDLTADDFDTRNEAMEALTDLGANALQPLREALDATDDPDLQWRLEELIAKIRTSVASTDEQPQRLQGRVLRLAPAGPNAAPNRNGGPGVVLQQLRLSIVNTDESGTYELETNDDGSVRVTARPVDGDPETRTFESMEEFRTEWPEVAEKLPAANNAGGFQLRFQPAGPQGQANGNPQQMAEDMARRLQELVERARQAAGNGADEDEMRERAEELRRELLQRLRQQQLQGGDVDSDSDADADADGESSTSSSSTSSADSRQAAQTAREADEQRVLDARMAAYMQKLRALAQQRPDPQADPDAFARWQESMSELQRGFRELQLQQRERQANTTNAPRQNAFAAAVETPSSAGGATFGAVSAPIRAQLDLDADEGLLVTAIADEGPLASAGLTRYDVLVAVNGSPVGSVEDVIAALAEVPAESEFVVQVIRRAERIQLIGKSE